MSAGFSFFCTSFLPPVFSKSIHGFPLVDISLDLTKRTHRAAKGHHGVIKDRSRDAISGSVESPHGDSWSTQTAFIHVSSNLAPKAHKTKRAADTDSAVTEAITEACLPVGVLGCTKMFRLSHNDSCCLSLHFQLKVFEEIGWEQKVAVVWRES
jgi:hypothetical protein